MSAVMTCWWPSKYGDGDEAGALNETTPAKVILAVELVRRGIVYDLAHVLHADIPAFPGRTFRQYLTTNYHQINARRPDRGPAGWGRNSVNWIVEQITATQQMGTHMDALNHLQEGDRTYNGYRLADIAEDHGTSSWVSTHCHRSSRAACSSASPPGEAWPGSNRATSSVSTTSSTSTFSPATRCSFTPDGVRCRGRTTRVTARVSRVRAWPSRRGWSSAGSR
jgi:putative cyclase